MASLPNQPAAPKKGRVLRHALRIDMTPLVDLGFLLITFFVFTSSLSNSYAMSLVVPAEGPPSPAAESTTLTVLLGAENKVFAYTGFFDEAVAQNKIEQTTYSSASGIGSLIRSQQKGLQAQGKLAGDLLLVIKPTTAASYKNVVDMLDEVTINGVRRYALVAPAAPESAYIINR